MLCCLALMDQAPVLDGLCFDLLPFCQDCRAAPEVDVGGCQIAEAFVIPAMVVVLCIDPAESAQVKPLKHMPQRMFLSDVSAYGTDLRFS